MTLPIIIHIAQEADWLPVMQKIEKLWPDKTIGRDRPTEFINIWQTYKSDTGIYINSSEFIEYADCKFYKIKYKETQSIPILPAKEFLAEEKSRCEYELIVEKYMGLKPKQWHENTPCALDMGQLIDLVCATHQHFCGHVIPSTAPDIVQELESIRDGIELLYQPEITHRELTRLIERLKG